MITPTILFTVFGEPKTAGSKRAFYNARLKRALIVDACGKSRDWKEQVASAGHQAYQGPLLTGPLAVGFHFVRVRPASHFNSRGELNKAGRASLAPDSRPDLLKLARCAEDALTGVMWKDDAQIVYEVLSKEWGEPARLEVTVETYSARQQRIGATHG